MVGSVLTEVVEYEGENWATAYDGELLCKSKLGGADMAHAATLGVRDYTARLLRKL